MKIFDKDISFSNYATFKECRILDDGSAIRFIMDCGASYIVPLEYLLKWFSRPHYLYEDNKLKPWYNSKCKDSKPVKIVKCCPILRNGAMKVFLNDNSVYVVAWDTVLMACEKNYEHFGGLTENSKRTVYEWFENGKK